MTEPPTIDDVAFAWAVRTADPAFADWEAFLAWVDGDPARNDAYNRAAIVVADAAAAPVRDTATIVPLPARPAADRVSPVRRWWIAGTGLALAAGVAGVLLIDRPADPPAWQVIETAAGRTRPIALADGSRIDLAGASRLRLDPARPRMARLDRGRAIFTVRHDAAAPYEVLAGTHRIVDAGTVFDVSHAPAATRVEVAEGLVVVDPAAAAVRLKPGRAVELVPGRPARIEAVAPEGVGQWRREHLTYADAPLARVAADLSVALGHPVITDDSVAARRVTVTITPATLKGKPQEAAELFGVRVVAGDDGWRLSAR